MIYKKIERKHKRTIVVGDIHGCFDELVQLLDTVAYTDSDLLITTGDMVDRGPKSWETVRFCKENDNAVSVLGNHERRLAGTIRGTSQPAWSQKQTLSKMPKHKWENWAEYLEHLPAVIETNEVVVTHARLDPEKQLDGQDPCHTCAVGGERVIIEKDRKGTPLWYLQMMEKRNIFKPVCIGHVQYPSVELVEGNLYALDTGAVRGKFLTAVIFPEKRIVSVQSGSNYYEKARNEWLQQQYIEKHPQDYAVPEMLKLMKKTELTHYQKQAVKRFADYITSLNIDERYAALKEQLEKRFGTLPPPGPERGTFYTELKQKIADNSLKKTAQYIVSGKAFRLEHLHGYKTVQDFMTALEKLRAAFV